MLASLIKSPDAGKEPATQRLLSTLASIAASSCTSLLIDDKDVLKLVGEQNGIEHAIALFTQQHQLIRGPPKHCEIRVDMAAEYEEFIPGKKNGKLNKIIKSSGTQLDLKYGQASLHLIITTTVLDAALDAFHQLKVSLLSFGEL